MLSAQGSARADTPRLCCSKVALVAMGYLDHAANPLIGFPSNKTLVSKPFFGFRLPQRQSNHQPFGGSVWESNVIRDGISRTYEECGRAKKPHKEHPGTVNVP